MDITPDNWSAVEKHFAELTNLNTNEQERYLEKLHQTDPNLYQLLHQLLAEDESLHPLFSQSGADIINTWQDEEPADERIGIYKIEKHLGQGAMASVYLAKRDDGEFEQWVALKLIKAGVHDEYTAELFRKERQTLATFQHPHIARLYDGGVTEQGGPFFTMEYIEGTPLTQYCEEHKLTLNQRLELFLQLCRGVKYAHNKLIAHLDLKPGNILVDKEGQVKVLDFGIARMMEPMKARTSVVEEAQISKRFTLAYASPEQIIGNEMGSTSDIYTLGVILHELITGQHPFEHFFESPQQLKNAIINGNYLCFSDFKRLFPSNIKNNNHSRELEQICLGAMKVSIEDRYSSVDAIVRDIESFINFRPISVIDTRGLYITKKFLQRNYRIVTPVIVGTIALSLTIFIYTQEVKEQRNLAQTEATKAVKVTEFLTGIFKMADPYEVNGDTITAVQLLEQGLQNINESLKDQPAIKASLLNEISGIYLSLGRLDEADSLSRVAYHLTDSLYEYPHAEIARSLHEIASVELYDFRLDSALKRLQESLSIHQQLKTKDQSTLATLYQNIGNIYYEKKDFVLADSLYRKAYDMHLQYLTPPHLELANDLQLLGAVNRKVEKFDISEEYYLQSLQMKNELYDSPHEQIAYTLNHLSSLKQNQGLLEEAIPYAEASYKQRKQIFGPAHIETNASLSNLARIHYQLGNDSIAMKHYEEVVKIFEFLFPDGHYYVSATTFLLANLHLKSGNLSLAEELARANLEKDRKILASNPVYLSRSMLLLGKILLKRDHGLMEAKDILTESYQIRKENLQAEDDQVIESQQTLGACLLALGEYEEAITVLHDAYQTLNEKADTDTERITEVMQALKMAYEKTGNQTQINKFEQLISRKSS